MTSRSRRIAIRIMKSAIHWGKTTGLALLVVLTISVAPAAASTTEQIAMLVPNIPGSSTLTGHTGWIDLVSFSGSAVAPSATGAGQPCQMMIQKDLDIASPHLWLSTVAGQAFSTIKIDVVTTGITTPYVVLEIVLENAQISSIADSGSNAVPQETVTFKATKEIVTFYERNPTTGVLTATTTSFTC